MCSQDHLVSSSWVCIRHHKIQTLSGCYSNSFGGGGNHLFPVFVSLVGLIEDLAGNGEKLVTQARRFLP